MTRSPSLLVNYWYAHPVGHALEGMRYALGYKAANPEVHVSLLLNGATAVELARCCTFIDDVHAVPFTEFHDAAGDPAEALAGVPRSWDWVVENHRAREDSHKEMHGFRAFFHAAREHFSTRHPVGVAGRDPPAYEPHQDLRVELPADACAAAAATTGGRQAIAVVLAGSSAARHLYPSAASWELILGALSEGHPEAALLLIGKHAPDGRTTSRPSERRGSRSRAGTGTSTSSTASRSTRCSRTRSGIPPFAWDGVAGEALPALEQDEDGEGPRTPSMSIARIREDLPELLHAAEILIDKRLSYPTRSPRTSPGSSPPTTATGPARSASTTSASCTCRRPTRAPPRPRASSSSGGSRRR